MQLEQIKASTVSSVQISNSVAELKKLMKVKKTDEGIFFKDGASPEAGDLLR